MNVKIEVEVRCPSVPKFIKAGETMIDIKELTTDQLLVIGQEWTKNLIEESNRRRKASETT